MNLRNLAVAGALALVPASPAAAAPWRQVTASGGAGIDQVGIVRTADGVLHVAWHRQTPAGAEDLLHTRIGADGRIGATTPIVSGWAGVLDAALTPAPGGGLRVFWGGTRSTDSTEVNRDLNSALSSDGGATWTLQPGPVAPPGQQAYASDVSAAALPDGTPLEAWYGTLGMFVHAGLDPGTPSFDYQAPLGSYGNLPGLAADAGGRATVAWFSSAAGHVGVLAQAVGAGGAPAGPVMRMPGTQVMVGNGTVSRTPVVARARSGGFYVAYPVGYPTPAEVRLWKVGASRAALIARATGNPSVAVAPDAKGRLWVAWSAGTFGEKRILARRSNRSATRFGATVDAGAPKGANSISALDASAAGGGALDVLGLFGVGDESGGSTYLRRVLPGLTLEASPARLPAGGRRVTFTVTEAGDPVRGATVRAGGRSGRTDAKGRVRLALTVGRAAARATAAGYAPASVTLK